MFTLRDDRVTDSPLGSAIILAVKCTKVWCNLPFFFCPNLTTEHCKLISPYVNFTHDLAFGLVLKRRQIYFVWLMLLLYWMQLIKRLLSQQQWHAHIIITVWYFPVACLQIQRKYYLVLSEISTYQELSWVGTEHLWQGISPPVALFCIQWNTDSTFSLFQCFKHFWIIDEIWNLGLEMLYYL